MKKLLITIFCLSMILLSGCGKQDIYKDTMKKYAIDYYQKYMQKVDMNEYVITIGMLKNANEKVNSNYNLSVFDNCSNNSSVSLVVTDRGYEYKFNLKCEN